MRPTCATLPNGSRRALTLVEAVLSILIVSLMLVAALNTYGAQKLAERRGNSRALGLLIADELMAEILQKSYEEPVDVPAWGLETGESIGTRKNFDDVDDYNGWSGSPPEDANGVALSVPIGWTRSVTVIRPDTTDYEVDKNAETGIKTIKVVIAFNGLEIARLASIKCKTSPF